MDAKIIEILLQSGIAGVALIAFGRAIIQLYNNMRDDHQKQLLVSQAREDELVRQLEKFHTNFERFNESLLLSNAKIVQTLDNMCVRITQIEQSMVKKE